MAQDQAAAAQSEGGPRGRGGVGETARQTYQALLKRGLTRAWAIRGATGLGVGLAAGLLTGNWRIGATFGVAAVILLVVRSARRYSEVPHWRRPSAAQRRTEAQLRLMKRMGYRTLHARSVKGGNGQIDHFVVGRRGAFAIDSEAWDKRLPVRNKLENLFHGRYSKNERIDEALEEAKAAQEAVSEELGREITVHPALALYGPKLQWDHHILRGVHILTGTRVRKWLRQVNARLSEEEIEEIFQAAQRALPPRT
ncbi:nuclease-related domain-containing protein [Salinactinospora qingdaonensis]|uniref:nuclease-related domain-containing protein n=1 Tax=Salinactinospora qingdaonensis TaxID=702744 RepID=UPI003CD0881B